MEMPEINYTPTNDWEQTIISLITNKNKLRATKPLVPKMKRIVFGLDLFNFKYEFETKDDLYQGQAAYIWRMVAFSINSKEQHHCIPMTATFGLPSKYNTKELDNFVDHIIDSVPKENWHGIKRWRQILI